MSILKHEREIQCIDFPHSPSILVGLGGITKIEAYEESGEMASVVWFKVYKAERIIAFVNSKHVQSVQYEI